MSGNTFLLAKTVQQLSDGARVLLDAMALEAGGKSVFEFPLKAVTKYGISATSFERRKKELISAGFLKMEICGRLTREPNKYSFSLEWKAREDALRAQEKAQNRETPKAADG